MPAHPPEHYQQVAEVYDEAMEAGDPPTRSVADAFSVPYTTAARWVRRTRAMGLLPAAAAGKPLGNRTAQ